MKLVKEIRSRSGKLHFRRYAIFSTKWISLYLHRIYKADEDEHLHNHPWNSKSIILSGEYYSLSKISGGQRLSLKSPMSYTSMDRYDFHKIFKIVKGPVTSLFLTYGKHEDWGYDVNGKFVDFTTYRTHKSHV